MGEKEKHKKGKWEGIRREKYGVPTHWFTPHMTITVVAGQGLKPRPRNAFQVSHISYRNPIIFPLRSVLPESRSQDLEPEIKSRYSNSGHRHLICYDKCLFIFLYMQGTEQE